MNNLYVVYMVIPPEENTAYVDAVPDFDFTGCIDQEGDGTMYSWSFLTMEDATEARKVAWNYCKNKHILGFVDLGIRYANGEENVEATMDMQEQLEDQVAEVVSDLAMEKTTGCIDVSMRALLKAAILDLETPPEIFYATAKELYEAILDDEGEEPPRMLH